MIHFPRWKILLILAFCGLGILYAVPNLLSAPVRQAWLGTLPSWMPGQTVNLGLDLRGGSHLLLEVDTSAVLTDHLTSLIDQTRSELRAERIGYTALAMDGQGIKVTLRDPAQLADAMKLLRKMAVGADLTADAGVIRVQMTDKGLYDLRQGAVVQSVEIVRRRIDETGTREPSIQQQGENRILVQLPGVDDPNYIKSLLGQTAKLSFRFVDETATPQDVARGIAPLGSDLLPLTARPDQKIAVQRKVIVSGDTLVDSQPSFQDGMPVVSFRFDAIGARRFADATKTGVGRLFAIVLDEKVISAPSIREPILGGSGVISGSFTVKEASDLALLLRAGALPAPLKVVEERTVGPGLGADSIKAGLYACLVGFLLVCAYMILAYRLFGVFATIALFLNIVLTIAALTILQATLTLPGIAGILLTLGMAVDANILINERIYEETRLGKSPISALDAGYTRAFSTIIDTNLTTLLKMMILFMMGVGVIKGFAITISLGILISMFTSLTVVRLMMVTWLRRTRPVALPI
jgi:preprotein translocase subunit SecD